MAILMKVRNRWEKATVAEQAFVAVIIAIIATLGIEYVFDVGGGSSAENAEPARQVTSIEDNTELGRAKRLCAGLVNASDMYQRHLINGSSSYSIASYELFAECMRSYGFERAGAR